MAKAGAMKAGKSEKAGGKMAKELPAAEKRPAAPAVKGGAKPGGGKLANTRAGRSGTGGGY